MNGQLTLHKRTCGLFVSTWGRREQKVSYCNRGGFYIQTMHIVSNNIGGQMIILALIYSNCYILYGNLFPLPFYEYYWFEKHGHLLYMVPTKMHITKETLVGETVHTWDYQAITYIASQDMVKHNKNEHSTILIKEILDQEDHRYCLSLLTFLTLWLVKISLVL